jgi:hypothetical protein
MTIVMLLLCAVAFTLLASTPIVLIPKMDPVARMASIAIIFISVMACTMMSSILSTGFDKNGRPVSNVASSKQPAKSQ